MASDCDTELDDETIAQLLNAYGDGTTFHNLEEMKSVIFEEICDSAPSDYALEECNHGAVVVLHSGAGFVTDSTYYDHRSGEFLAWSKFADGGGCEWWPMVLNLGGCGEIHRLCTDETGRP